VESVSPPYQSSQFVLAAGDWGSTLMPDWYADALADAVGFSSFSGTEAQLHENARLYEASNGKHSAFSEGENTNIIVSNLVKAISEPVVAVLSRTGGLLSATCKEELSATLYVFVNSRVGTIHDAAAGTATHAVLTQTLFEGIQEALSSGVSCVVGSRAAKRKAYQLAINMSFRFGVRFVPFVGQVALAQDSAAIGLALGNSIARIVGLAGDYSDSLLVQAAEEKIGDISLRSIELLLDTTEPYFGDYFFRLTLET